MDWLNEPWFEIPAFVTLAVGASIAVKQFWQHIMKPIWAGMKGAVNLAETHQAVTESLPILKELNAQFKPNHGTSIHDHITRLDRRQETIDGKLDDLTSMFQTHIASVQPGGRRSIDPQ